MCCRSDLLSAPDRLDSTCVSDPRQAVTLRDGDGAVRGLRVGLPAEYHCPGMEPEVLRAWEETAERLSRAGATVTQVSHHCQMSLPRWVPSASTDQIQSFGSATLCMCLYVCVCL